MAQTGIEKKKSNNFIRHANVWQDGDILCDALSTCKGGRILSIASSGDNVLALLTVDPKEIIAADVNQSQLACLELRISAFRHLDYYALLAFLGVTQTNTRKDTYHELRSDLTPFAREFWDHHLNDIENGIIHAGKLERYLRFLSKFILPLIHSRKKWEALLQKRSHFEQVEFYDQQWDSFSWQLMFRIVFSRMLLGRLINVPGYYDRLYGTFAERMMMRTRHALTELSTHTNPYLTYIVKGNYDLEALPRYLRAEFKETIALRADRISLVCSPVHQTNRGPFDGFNLSDIFAYLDEKEYESLFQELISQANPHARLAYWNMFLVRGVPPSLEDKVESLGPLSEVLHWRDKSWYYQAFHVDEVL